MDLLDDILSEPSAVKAPARARFQPKAKPRPKTGPKGKPGTSIPGSSESSQLVQPNDSVENNNEHSGNFISKSSGDTDLSAEKSLGSKVPEDIVGVATETPTLDACTTQIEEEISGFPDVDFAGVSPFRAPSAQTAHDLSIPSAEEGSGRSKEALFNTAEDFQIDMEQGAEEFACGEAEDIFSDAVTVSGKRAVKYQPKPKAQSSRQKDIVEVVSNVPDAPKASPENQHLYRNVSIGGGDTVSDLSHVRLDGDFTIESTTVQSDTVVTDDIDSLISPDAPKESREHGKRKMSDAFNITHTSRDTGPTASGVIENEHEFVDGVNDVNHYSNSSSSAKAALDEPAISRDESNDADYIGEETSKKRKPRKPKKVASENDKPARKRKKGPKESDESTEKPRKKFPHATRRKRSVDKSLLEAPEDEIDLHRVPIRDLIILAEYKERQAKKDAAVVLPASTNERNDDNSLPEDPAYDYDDTYGSDQDTGSLDNPSISRVLNDTSCYNYHTYMKDKIKRVRWSKQDTELFYQGVEQFGSDFSMIAELFPGRSRDQMKLKYKKEEREHPMMLHEALTSRAKNHSHFELVIQRLQEQAKQKAKEEAEKEAKKAKQDHSDGDNLSHPTGEEEGAEEGTLHSHEAAKSEQQEEGSAADQVPDRAQVASPAKSYNSEDDIDFWNSCAYSGS